MRIDPGALARRLLQESGYFRTYHLCSRVNLEALLEHFGLEWHRRDLNGLHGALVCVVGRHYIVTHKGESSASQRFTAAHELKHYLTDRHLAPTLARRYSVGGSLEEAAERFARELLMPARVVRHLHRRGVQSPRELARVLGVTIGPAKSRLRELGLR